MYLSPTSVKTRGGMGANMKEDAAVMYRQIFGISRAVRIEFLGVWVSHLGTKLHLLGSRVELTRLGYCLQFG